MVPVHSGEPEGEPAPAGRQSVAGAAGAAGAAVAADADGDGGAEVPDAEPGVVHFVFVTAAADEPAGEPPADGD